MTAKNVLAPKRDNILIKNVHFVFIKCLVCQIWYVCQGFCLNKNYFFRRRLDD